MVGGEVRSAGVSAGENGCGINLLVAHHMTEDFRRSLKVLKCYVGFLRL